MSRLCGGFSRLVMHVITWSPKQVKADNMPWQPHPPWGADNALKTCCVSSHPHHLVKLIEKCFRFQKLNNKRGLVNCPQSHNHDSLKAGILRCSDGPPIGQEDRSRAMPRVNAHKCFSCLMSRVGSDWQRAAQMRLGSGWQSRPRPAFNSVTVPKSFIASLGLPIQRIWHSMPELVTEELRFWEVALWFVSSFPLGRERQSLLDSLMRFLFSAGEKAEAAPMMLPPSLCFMKA